MPKVAVAYGPAAQRGVTQIMGLGADDYAPDPTRDMLKKAGWASVAIWAAGVVFNKPILRGIGLGGAAVGLGVKHLAEKDLNKPAAPVPTGYYR